METRYASRMQKMQKSVIREILKAIDKPGMISFAGGLPNPISFPVKEIKQATAKVLDADGENVLQYSTTEGYEPLREYIAQRYKKRFGLEISTDEILITNGSQQALDLIGKVFLNEGDAVACEKPSYLGMIQSFSAFEPKFYEAKLTEEGIDTDELSEILAKYSPKLFYSVPNFQNPTGISYSERVRHDTAEIISKSNTILIDDDPYGELRFIGEHGTPFMKLCREKVITLGSFSKIVSPGMRLGWIVAPQDFMDEIITVKQGADLHSNYFTQRVVYQYLIDNDIDSHIEKIKVLYKSQRDTMVKMIEKYFPSDVTSTRPEGGMFLWITLPQGMSSLEIFEKAYKNNVAFVPGGPFYANGDVDNTLRLNYTNSDTATIEKGIKVLGNILKDKL